MALRAMEEQQHIIGSLHELVRTLKRRVGELEGARPGGGAAPAEERRELQEALAASEHARGAAEGRCASLAATAASAEKDMEVLVAHVQDVEFQLERERRARQLADGTCARLTESAAALQTEAHHAGLERTRWKALATALAHRMEPSVQSRVLLHIRAIEEEDDRRRGDGPRRAAAPPAVVESASPEVHSAWRRSCDDPAPAGSGARAGPALPSLSTYPAPLRRAGARAVGPLPPL
ncbi:hypothetical protein STCU_09998 [Strigomonas culicis]|uniref:Uncharacterized protein n=1 Tax=Strigomonas culicis TaxID=28005 RepID=S9TJS4_9TRYP|nr:hypothetical protein STCU_09998 [Strigomonas culicis]|eukprot:EPY18392.1 hypothetical protein STCU_09998 [Strigomonas culicis]